jgi:hypothetical protein
MVGEVLQQAARGRGISKRPALQNPLDPTLHFLASLNQSIVMIAPLTFSPDDATYNHTGWFFNGLSMLPDC